MADVKTKPKYEKTDTMISPRGQFAFLYAYEPHTEGEYKDDKYKTTFLIDEAQKEELLPIKKAILAVAQKHWGSSVKYRDLETPFKSGDEFADLADKNAKERGKEPGKMNNFRGKIYFRAKSARKPGIVGPDKKSLPEGEDVQAGDFGRISIVARTYERTADVIRDGKRGKETIRGVSFWLQNILKLKTGERFGGGKSAEQDFEETEIDALDLEENKKASAEEDFDEKESAKTESHDDDEVF